jgi:hypothetical protein
MLRVTKTNVDWLQKSGSFPKDRNIELILKKKDDGPYWQQLTKEKQKFHWLKVDFNKWKDEDDSEDEGGTGQNQDLDEVKGREVIKNL